jgi:hypothetical protein
MLQRCYNGTQRQPPPPYTFNLHWRRRSYSNTFMSRPEGDRGGGQRPASASVLGNIHVIRPLHLTRLYL